MMILLRLQVDFIKTAVRTIMVYELKHWAGSSAVVAVGSKTKQKVSVTKMKMRICRVTGGDRIRYYIILDINSL